MKNRRNERGLSLVEVLLAAVMISVMAGAVYVTLSQGIRLWRRAVEEKPELKMDLFYDRIQSDLRNAFSYESGHFGGGETGLEFLTLCPIPWEDGKTSGGTAVPARVRYFFNPETASIYREQIRYEKVLHPKSNAAVQAPRPVMDNIRGFNLEYYERDKENAYHWRREWSKGCLPRAVKILIEYGQTGTKSVSRIVDIPASQGCLS